jgi:hypothetical protein
MNPESGRPRDEPMARRAAFAGTVLLPATRQTKEQRRSLGGRFEVGPLCQETTSRHLGTARRTHFDFELALRVTIETIDHCGPISDFPHGDKPNDIDYWKKAIPV